MIDTILISIALFVIVLVLFGVFWGKIQKLIYQVTGRFPATLEQIADWTIRNRIRVTRIEVFRQGQYYDSYWQRICVRFFSGENEVKRHVYFTDGIGKPYPGKEELHKCLAHLAIVGKEDSWPNAEVGEYRFNTWESPDKNCANVSE